MRTQSLRKCACVFLLAAVLPAPAYALPTMIRLGYTNCAVCHLSPQGGGLLTPYGKGVDAAQSLFTEEPRPPDEQLTSLYDVRAVFVANMLSSEAKPGTLSASTLRTMFRNAVNMSSHTRVSYQAGLDATMTGNMTMAPAVGTGGILVSKAIFEYHPRDGISVQVGRDTLPDGLGLPDPQTFMRRQHDPSGTAFPIQAKAFLWNSHCELTPYVYGPGFDETRRVARQRGAGVVGGLDLGKRAVVGMTARTAHSDAFDRKSVGPCRCVSPTTSRWASPRGTRWSAVPPRIRAPTCLRGPSSRCSEGLPRHSTRRRMKQGERRGIGPRRSASCRTGRCVLHYGE